MQHGQGMANVCLIDKLSLNIFTSYNKISLIMGCTPAKPGASTDVYDILKQNNLSEFKDFIVGEEITKSIEGSAAKLKSQLTFQSAQQKANNLDILSQQEEQVKQAYSNVKQKVDKNFVGGVKALEQMKHNKLENLVGLNSCLEKFHKIKNEYTSNYAQQQQKMVQELDQVKAQQIRKVQGKKPQIGFYEHLTSEVKNSIYDKASKQFEEEIGQRGSDHLKQIDHKFNKKEYLGRFQNIFPLEGLKRLTEISKEELNIEAKKITGGVEDSKTDLF